MHWDDGHDLNYGDDLRSVTMEGGLGASSDFIMRGKGKALAEKDTTFD